METATFCEVSEMRSKEESKRKEERQGRWAGWKKIGGGNLGDRGACRPGIC